MPIAPFSRTRQKAVIISPLRPRRRKEAPLCFLQYQQQVGSARFCQLDVVVVLTLIGREGPVHVHLILDLVSSSKSPAAAASLTPNLEKSAPWAQRHRTRHSADSRVTNLRRKLVTSIQKAEGVGLRGRHHLLNTITAATVISAAVLQPLKTLTGTTSQRQLRLDLNQQVERAENGQRALGE